jgi:hypothetical protein
MCGVQHKGPAPPQWVGACVLNPLIPPGGLYPDCAAGCLIRPGRRVHRYSPLNPARANGHLRMYLVVSQPPPVTGGQRPPLGRMLPNFTGRPLQSVPPRGTAADESAGTCGTGSALPIGRVTSINTQHPPTIVMDIPGASCCPPPGTQMSTPIPAIILGSTGAFMRYSSLGL